MRVLSSVGLLTLVSLASCKSGGDAGVSFTVATTDVAFSGSVGGPTPASRVVQGSIVGVNGTVYLVVVMTNRGISSVTFNQTGPTTGDLVLVPRAPDEIGAGTFTDTVVVHACRDAACQQEISGSPRTIRVTYDVVGVSASPPQVALSAVEGVASAAVPVQLVNHSGSPAWTASVAYPGAAGWLAVTPSSGSSAAPSLSLQGGALPPGDYGATLTVSAGGHSVDVPVAYSVQRNLAASPPLVFLSAVAGQAVLPAAAPVALSAALGATSTTTSIAYGPGASGWLSASASSAPGTLTISPTTTALAPGTHGATVTAIPQSGSPLDIPVTYTLDASALTLAPSSVGFSLDASSTPVAANLERTVATGDTGAALTWTASASVPWLTVTAAGASGDPATVGLVPAGLASALAGDSSATVTFTYDGPFVSAATATLGVTLHLDLPTVDFVSPQVGYLGEQQEVIVRGSGFTQPGLAPLRIGGLAPASVDVRSDTEIRVVPPSFGSASRQLVSIDNALGVVRSRAELVVRDHPGHPYAALATGIGIQGGHVVYDAERDAVLSSRPYFASTTPPLGLSAVVRFSRDPGSGAWSMATQAFPQLHDIALGPDGRELLVLCATQLHRVDPVSLSIVRSVALPGGALSNASELAVLNDGTVIVRSLGIAYSLVKDAFRPLPLLTGTVGIDTGPDGSRAVMGEATNASDVPLSWYDASTGTLHATTAFQYYSPGKLSRTASKLLSGVTVRDAAFAALGVLPGVLGEAMTPDGNRAYAMDYSVLPPRVRVFDVSASAATFPELSPLALPDDPGVVRSAVSLDGQTLFLVGETRFLVVPAP